MSTERTDETVNDPIVGRRLASYEVLARVAAGGMGVVYRARHVYIDKIVALKVLDHELASRPELIERFRTEAQSLARVEHENVVKVIDILEDKGLHFIVMDFADGTNLRVYVKRKGPMKGEELLSVARQTAEALHAAHREGILHRDIKPENLIMNNRGRCKLADFGLAGDLRLISEGHEGPLNFGTPAYSAPEVMRRMVPDRRSDIFSYGATLYFLATGEPPFGQTGAQQILARQKQGATPLEARRPDLGPKLCRLVNDCIKWHPKERPESFREIIERLPRRTFAPAANVGDTTLTEPTGLLTTEAVTVEHSGVPRVLALGSVVVGLAAIVLVAVLWWANRDTTPDTTPDPDKDSTAQIDNRSTQPTPTDGPPTDEDPAEVPPVDPGTGDTPAQNETDAFNDADLASTVALGRAAYSEAFQAWTRFLTEFPDSALAGDATRRRSAVRQRVMDLRESELRKAREASTEALSAGRTAEALAAVDRFPAELLVALDDSDEVSVRTLLDSQRQNVIAAEAAQLAQLLERADTLRAEWNESVERADQWLEARRIRYAGNLLQERDLLEQFLPGRTADAQERITARLGRLRKILEGVHQSAAVPATEWRLMHDRLLGEWAHWLDEQLESVNRSLARRDFTGAMRKTQDLRTQLREKTAEQRFRSPKVADAAREPALLLRAIEEFEQDVRLAAGLPAALETELRELRASGVVREFQIHVDEDRTVTHVGRVTSVGNNRFTIAIDSSQITIQYSDLTANSVRRIARGTNRPETLIRLLAWLAAQEMATDVDAEIQRLERLELTTADHLRTAAALRAANRLAPETRARLQYLAARCGVIRVSEFLEAHGEESREARLLLAQRGLAEGDVVAANSYIVLVRELADPELVHLEALERAIDLATPVEGDLRNRVALEPLSADALTALARYLLERGEVYRARELAGQALLIDGSSEEAWLIRRG